MSATAELRPDATPEARAAAAYRDGVTAARTAPRAPCPFDADAGAPTVRVCAVMWTRGYGAGNPMPEPDDGSPDVDPRPGAGTDESGRLTP